MIYGLFNIRNLIFMKKVVMIILLWVFVYATAVSQTKMNSGTYINVVSGTNIVVNDLVSTSGVIINDGTMHIQGDVTNNSGNLFDASSTGSVLFNGSVSQEISGAASIHFYGNLTINNTNGVSLTNSTTGAEQFVHGSLSFTTGILDLTDFDLTLDGTADPSGVGSSVYIKTSGTGTLNRTVGSNNILFPVGNSTYNPVVINNSGTSDTYGVKVTDSKPVNFVGNDDIVNRSWDISEENSGGSDLSLSFSWNSSEEATGFDRTKSYIGRTDDAGNIVLWGNEGSATGSGPYTHSDNPFSSVGTFMIGDNDYADMSVDAVAILGGCYNVTNGNMDKDLNTAGLIPLTDPYGLSTSVNSIPANAVDWVRIDLRDESDRSIILKSYARFINQNGQIVNGDDANLHDLRITGDFHMSVMHRNHLGIVSTHVIDMNTGTPVKNFSTAQSKAWQDGAITTNAAMKEVETGVFGLWEGDATNDKTVKYNGADNDRTAILTEVGASTPGGTVTNVYSDNDINMDGDVIYNGSGNDRTAILTVVGASTPGLVLSEHIPY